METGRSMAHSDGNWKGVRDHVHYEVDAAVKWEAPRLRGWQLQQALVQVQREILPLLELQGISPPKGGVHLKRQCMR